MSIHIEAIGRYQADITGPPEKIAAALVQASTLTDSTPSGFFTTRPEQLLGNSGKGVIVRIQSVPDYRVGEAAILSCYFRPRERRLHLYVHSGATADNAVIVATAELIASLAETF